LSSAMTYLDFFPRHSFGEVRVLLYDRHETSETGFTFRLIENFPIGELTEPVFVLSELPGFLEFGSGFWDDLKIFTPCFKSGMLVKGEVLREKNSLILKPSEFLFGEIILSEKWREPGIRHVDFIEKAVPIPEEHIGFNDYVRRWCERELKDQGYIENRMEPEEYYKAFMRIGKPIRYHFFLSEETKGEPECYYKQGKFVLPCGCPVFEDLLSDRLEHCEGNEYWGPVWQDPEYPLENSVWMWIQKKDTRLISVLSFVNRSGNFSVMLVPFYFKLLI
jgi:hypothetical protein